MLRLLLCSFLLSFSSINVAAEVGDIYALVGVGYAESDVNGLDSDETSYRLAVGYEFHRQWYVELGYNQLSSGFDSKALPTTVQEAESFNSGGVDASGLFLGFLGKASGASGELFYRLSVMTLSVKSDSVMNVNDSCDVGDQSTIVVDTGENYLFCSADESVIAGGLGLGFDFNLTNNWKFRLEYEHIRGEDDIQFNTAYAGIRYTF